MLSIEDPVNRDYKKESNMPSVSLTLPDIEQSVARPIIFSILDQVFEITQLSKETHIYYAGKRNVIQSPGTSIDDVNGKDARFSSDRYTFIDVDEKYAIDAVQETFVHAFEHRPVFEDQKLKLSLRPIYTTSDVVINIRYRSPSETEVKRWMAEMLLKTARGRDISLHDVKYTYPLPYPFVGLIEDIWSLREKVEGYNESFKDYFEKHASDRLTILANRAGEMRHLAISEKQTRIQGFFDFVGVPESPTRDDASGTWELSFSYKFSYQRPDAVYLHYPISVHNQLLPEKYLNYINTEPDPYFQNKYYSKSYEALSLFEGDHIAMATREPYPYITLPSFDDFKMETTAPGTATVLTALCFVEDDKHTLMDLKELGDYEIDSEILNFLKTESPYTTKLFHSFFYISVYRDEFPINDIEIELTSDLILRSKKPLDLRRVYHVRVSMLIEIGMAIQPALDRLSLYPSTLVKVLGAINELLKTDPDFNSLAHKKHIEKWELEAIYRVLSGGTRTNGFGPSSPIPTFPYDNIDAWPNGHRKRFLDHINESVVREYFQAKRRIRPSIQVTGVIVHPRTTEQYADKINTGQSVNA